MRPALRDPVLRAGALVAGGLLLAACGSSGGGGASKAASSPSGGGKPRLSILAPADGATVTGPVKLRISTNAPIGPTDSGKDHVHVFLDGRTQDYTVVPATSYTIKNMPSGKHTISVTLQHADHSPAGADAQVTVTVKGGAKPKPASSPSSTGGGGGPYNY